ncbi:hypothetical protein [Chitinophaga varians]|uniref:hypothetical protein n=1 Tax=Chitinophaga varians TaxID=2202339 RepID=UPI00165F6BD7|nr:hypothetical protein [Chitinophaga varians]MBC9914306.1 hypothetical protein [Chitinophaga varians]
MLKNPGQAKYWQERLKDMVTEIVKKYGNFADALVLGFSIESYTHSSSGKGNIEVLIHCMNGENDFEWEQVKLVFEEVMCFRFIENRNTSSVVINAAILNHENDEITFDFFPLMFNHEFVENPASDFVIKCKRIKYSVV